MLRAAKAFKSLKLRANDGDIGKAKEFYFDDKFWTVRYLVADTGGWLSGRLVLISPHALGTANEAELVLPVELTKKQIEECPLLASHQPVSRQYEAQYFGYFNWPTYWNGPYSWGMIPPMDTRSRYLEIAKNAHNNENVRHENAWDPNLRSTSDVTGHVIQAQDGEIGHVEDFIIDDETWAIRYLVVDTRKWWSGKSVLIAPQWIERVSWKESKVFLNLSCETIKETPEYIPESLNRDYETILHRHYNRQGYWDDELAAYNTWAATNKEHIRK